ncbi:MAG: hypothetical protein JWM78_2418 [Verrucomicrobiaceae bacterium]|nr:hypothetical protein [Verrucomicrobiaceae bacterium]
MKYLNKRLLTATCTALIASSAVFTSAAHADLTAAAGVASSYYWRGLQVSNGAQVWGEATYTLDSGFYGDLWASSEGFGVGPEYDLTAGWSGKFGDLGVNVGAVTYVYSKDNSQGASFDDNDPGDFSDAFVKLSYGDAFGGLYYNIAQAQSQAWVYAGYAIGKFTPSIGYQEFKDKFQTMGDSKWDYTYIDLTFAATKNLSFIVSSVIDHSGSQMSSFGLPANIDTNRAKVVVSYTLPIEM